MSVDDERLREAWADPKVANIVYHDWEASTYDEKWNISYDERCVSYARDRYTHVAGDDGWPFGRMLEIGAGTGFFTLNLLQAGVARSAVVTDISQGMVDVAVRNGQHLGLDVAGRAADAESLPFDDAEFDLVIGHAVLHHIPDLDMAFHEILRVLKPGGRFVFCGEPTQRGDVVARRLSTLAWWGAGRVTRLPVLRDRYARTDDELAASSAEAHLEAIVDLHTFDPDRLAALAMRAGAIDVRTVTEELTASWFGWPVRTIEAAVKPGSLGWNWAIFAYRTWLALDAADRRFFSRWVPDELFYNVSVTGVRP
ncbi:MAG: methyltransferase domain-containing protein [Candidatus Nanopelagicales bacterium]|jgi:ubiquinone/menaquinone biosynthesis C-methylase UbiE